MRLDRHDALIEAALDAARDAGLYLILRLSDLVERRLSIVDGKPDRQRTTRQSGLGLHVFTPDGSAGFASTDDLSPEAAREAVCRAGALAAAARQAGGARTLAPFALAGSGRWRVEPVAQPLAETPVEAQVQALVSAQVALADLAVGAEQTIRTSQHVADEAWRIVRTDGTDVCFGTPRAVTRHEISARLEGRIARATAVIGGVDSPSTLSGVALARLERRARAAARTARETTPAPPPRTGSYRLVLDHALAKGLAHEAIGHLCESDVDGSVLMQAGRLRLGARLARASVSVVDGPLPGDYAQQPVSANGIPRQAVTLIGRGVLAAGLGDLFSAEPAGVRITGACRAASFRDRPTPRMTNTRILVADALPLSLDPDSLAPEAVAEALWRAGLLEAGTPTLFLSGYRGGQAHPRRGDFIFGIGSVYDLSDGVAPRGAASLSGLAERALAMVLAGLGPVTADTLGTCGKDGSGVSSSGGSHTLLVLDPDPDLVVSAAAR